MTSAADEGGAPISIHALREEGDLQKQGYKRRMVISIHALREEGDDQDHAEDVAGDGISIHALREEGDRRLVAQILIAARISIHALREEGDSLGQTICHVQIHFYPRPPRGGRRSCP